MVQYRLATRSCLRTTSSTRPPDENGPNTNFGGEQKLNSKRRQLNCNVPREQAEYESEGSKCGGGGSRFACIGQEQVGRWVSFKDAMSDPPKKIIAVSQK